MDNSPAATTNVNGSTTAIIAPKNPDENENGPQLSPSRREAVLAKLNNDKNHTEIKAWEENKRTNSVNKYNRKLSGIEVWENTKKTTAEARLKLAEEKLEKKRVAYVERMRNELAYAHKKAEEMKAEVEVRKGQDLLKVEEAATNYHLHGGLPKWNKLLRCCDV